MQLWKRRLVGLLGVGGGAVGIAAVLSIIVQQRNPIEWFFSLVFALLYSWGVWSGLKALEGQPGAERSSLKFWLLQVPAFATPVLGYFFACGFHLTTGVQVEPLKFNANFMLGSSFNYSLGQSGTPTFLGVNVFALAMSVWLWQQARSLPPNNSSKPTPLRGAA